jgi:hypothetical protein
MKFLNLPIGALVARSVVKFIVALSVEVVLLFAIGVILFTVLSFFSRGINLGNLVSLLLTGIFVIFLFFAAFVFLLTPINIVLGFLGGIILALLLHLTKIVIKGMNSRKLLAAFFGGVVVGIAGHLNLLLYDYFTSTTVDWQYVDLMDTFWAALANSGDDLMLLWPAIMLLFLVILPSLMGINIGLTLVSQLDK